MPVDSIFNEFPKSNIKLLDDFEDSMSETIKSINEMMISFLCLMLPYFGHYAHADPKNLSFDDNIDWVNDISETMKKSKDYKLRVFGKMISDHIYNIKFIIKYNNETYSGQEVNIPTTPRNMKEMKLVKHYRYLLRFYYLLDQAVFMYGDN